MDYVIEKKIDYLHIKTNNFYFKNEEISQSEYEDFQNSESPEELGFTFLRQNVLLYRFLYRKTNRVYESIRPLYEDEKAELQNFTQERLDKDFYFCHTLSEEEVSMYFPEYSSFSNNS